MMKLVDCSEANQESKRNSLFTPLLGQAAKITQKTGQDDVSPSAESGILGVLSFSWLTELIKKGRAKTLEDVDIPDVIIGLI
ncbi:hypothetical protein LIER_09212 [Lithospermum erythrorhizon]|uniref:Uncharacterized protein n=1 Tax=Lithospermum erythrorhizon TaxID=34254 RepID=A0AAV3PJM9_LITER